MINLFFLILLTILSIILNIIKLDLNIDMVLFHNPFEIIVFIFTAVLSLLLVFLYIKLNSVKLVRRNTHDVIYNNDVTLSFRYIDLFIIKYVVIYWFINLYYQNVLPNSIYLLFIPILIILYLLTINSYYYNTKIPFITDYKIKDYLNLFSGKTKIYSFISKKSSKTYYEYITKDGQIFINDKYIDPISFDKININNLSLVEKRKYILSKILKCFLTVGISIISLIILLLK